MLTFFLICLAVGLLVGFLAGLFGIGGGMIIVPILNYILPTIGVPDNKLMAMSLGTSLATIVITGFSSAYAHNKNGNVSWKTAKVLAPTLMASIFVFGLIAGNIPKDIVSKIFACIVVYMAIKMVFDLRPGLRQGIKKLTNKATIIAGIIIGAIASMAGIGGGGFIVPFLNGRGINIRKAIGTSSFCGALLGLAGTISYIVGGIIADVSLPAYSIGYVYLPAVLGIAFTSVFTSKIGAWAADVLPVKILKYAFAAMLVGIAIDMFVK